ncbi:MAG: penicillin acylase family protein, partial [Pseudomonadota bacterium]|nr:penicillin acylase family protein [Pseudomonadota bacterium]
GSNSVAVAPARSASGGAWIASDTHLPALLPNPWLIAGCKAPSYHMVGLMIPGVPAMGLGRNPWIAWGGTNLHAASSDLFDVSALPAGSITTRRERLRVRWSGTRTIAIRETALGPVVSDDGLLPRRAGRHLALRWIGHAASDEMTALLGVNRARNWGEFRAALSSFAVPAQNMIYADHAGHIGRMMAARLPHRPPAPPPAPVRPAEDASLWEQIATGAELPAILDPAEGFVASANDEPRGAPILVGYFFSSAARVNRLRQVLTSAERIDFDALAALQRDVMMPSALTVRDRLLRLLRPERTSEALLGALKDWDGGYRADSAGALAFEVLLFRTALALGAGRRVKLYSRVWGTRDLLFRDLAGISDDALAAALARAAPIAARRLRAFGVWGRIHRISPRHFLASVPLLGRTARFGDDPASGGAETVLKTANPLTDRRHRTGLVATARHISDLADPDGNHFVLLGGQDGWLGSTTLLDQVPLWLRGAYHRVPLRLETVRAEFPFRTELRP